MPLLPSLTFAFSVFDVIPGSPSSVVALETTLAEHVEPGFLGGVGTNTLITVTAHPPQRLGAMPQ